MPIGWRVYKNHTVASLLDRSDIPGFFTKKVVVGPNEAAIVVKDGQPYELLTESSAQVAGAFDQLKSLFGGGADICVYFVELAPLDLTIFIGESTSSTDALTQQTVDTSSAKADFEGQTAGQAQAESHGKSKEKKRSIKDLVMGFLTRSKRAGWSEESSAGGSVGGEGHTASAADSFADSSASVTSQLDVSKVNIVALTADREIIQGVCNIRLRVNTEEPEDLVALLKGKRALATWDLSALIRDELLAKVMIPEIAGYKASELRGNRELLKSLEAQTYEDLQNTLSSCGLLLENFSINWGLTDQERAEIQRRRDLRHEEALDFAKKRKIAQMARILEIEKTKNANAVELKAAIIKGDHELAALYERGDLALKNELDTTRTEHGIDIDKLRQRGRIDQAKTEAEGDVDVAKTRKEGQVDVAKTGAEGQADVDQIKAQSAADIEVLQTQGKLDVQKIDTHIRRARLEGDKLQHDFDLETRRLDEELRLDLEDREYKERQARQHAARMDDLDADDKEMRDLVTQQIRMANEKHERTMSERRHESESEFRKLQLEADRDFKDRKAKLDESIHRMDTQREIMMNASGADPAVLKQMFESMTEQEYATVSDEKVIARAEAMAKAQAAGNNLDTYRQALTDQQTHQANTTRMSTDMMNAAKQQAPAPVVIPGGGVAQTPVSPAAGAGQPIIINNPNTAPQAPATATTPCGNCGNAVQPDWKACPACGNSIGSPSPKCPGCGGDVQAQWKACPGCGQSLAAAKPTCPNCSNDIQADWKACPSCGNSLS